MARFFNFNLPGVAVCPSATPVSYTVGQPCVFAIQGAYLLCSNAIRRDIRAV